MHVNRSARGGRPNSDEVAMVTLLVLAPAVARALGSGTGEAGRGSALVQEVHRISGGYLDYSTVWYFRERLAKISTDQAIWVELQRQLFVKAQSNAGHRPGRAFITADHRHAKAATPRGEDAKTRKSKNGSWTKKGTKSYFGYKLHSNVDTDLRLIRELATTTVAVHDSQVDLLKKGKVVYWDREGLSGRNAQKVLRDDEIK
jgi:IS5 family transposase